MVSDSQSERAGVEGGVYITSLPDVEDMLIVYSEVAQDDEFPVVYKQASPSLQGFLQCRWTSFAVCPGRQTAVCVA